jgi:hypothetical protein
MSPQQKALIVPEKQGKFEIGFRSVPNPGTGELLVKVQSALDPIDHNTIFLKHKPLCAAKSGLKSGSQRVL